jgi:hypothetical protein
MRTPFKFRASVGEVEVKYIEQTEGSRGCMGCMQDASARRDKERCRFGLAAELRGI